MQYSLDSVYTPGPKQEHQDIGVIKVTIIEGNPRTFETVLKPGSPLSEAAIAVLAMEFGKPVYFSGDLSQDNIEFVSYDDVNDHLTIKLK